MAQKGTEALDSAKPKAKAPAKAAGKVNKSAKPKKEVHHIIVRPLSDGSNHHEVVYKGQGGAPDPQSAEFSTANPQDAGAHVAQMLGGGDEDGDEGDQDAGGAAPAQ